jgi:hypothetical protein
MKSKLVFLLMATVATSALAQGVQEEFHGRWGVDSAATAARIAANPEMSAENKAYWAKRFTEGPESKIELIVTGASLEMPGFGEFLFGEILETSPGHVRVSASITDPRSSTEMKLALDLTIQEDGALNMRLDSGGSFDDDDFDRVMWTRSKEGAAVSSSVSSDFIEYLDSLKACTPGEFRFTNTGLGDIRSTIVGKSAEGCQVTTESAGHQIACDYSEATIALLTSAQKYEDATNGILQGSTDSEESTRMNQECFLQ